MRLDERQQSTAAVAGWQASGSRKLVKSFSNFYTALKSLRCIRTQRRTQLVSFQGKFRSPEFLMRTLAQCDCRTFLEAASTPCNSKGSLAPGVLLQPMLG